MDNEIAVATENTMALSTGRDPLSKYGMRHKGGVFTVIFVFNYNKEYFPKLFEAFITRNTPTKVGFLEVFDNLR